MIELIENFKEFFKVILIGIAMGLILSFIAIQSGGAARETMPASCKNEKQAMEWFAENGFLRVTYEIVDAPGISAVEIWQNSAGSWILLFLDEARGLYCTQPADRLRPGGKPRGGNPPTLRGGGSLV